MMNMFNVLQTEAVSRPPAPAPLLPEAEQQILQDLMSDAMEETDSLQGHMLQQNGQTLLCFSLFAVVNGYSKFFSLALILKPYIKQHSPSNVTNI